jgi:N-acetylmuramoyl-L-alanine amidase
MKRPPVIVALLCCALVAASAEIRYAGIAYTDANTAAAQLGLRPAPPLDGAHFAGGNDRLALTANKNACVFSGTKIALCFPAIRRDGRLYVSRLDLEKTLAPLSARRKGVIRHRIASITLDPGHGGRDQGASGYVLREKLATLLLARRVGAILRACGYRVHMTREFDYFVPLGERCRLQRAAKSDLFVSIHFNAAVNRTFHGIETYALTPAGAASSSGGKPSATNFSGNRNDANNMLLASSIQRALLKRTGSFDRGVKRARFAVLRDITAPGVLVEVGYLSNPREEKLLLDPAYREKLARAIAEGIIVYHRAVLRR